MWKVLGSNRHTPVGIGYTAIERDDDERQGIIRDANGRITYLGEIGYPHRPVRGRLFSGAGATLYDGDVDTYQWPKRGRMIMSDGRMVNISIDRNETWTSVVTYTNGDRALFDGNPPRIRLFERADGRTDYPSDGWDTATYPSEDASSGDSPPPHRPLIMGTMLCVPRIDSIVRYRDALADSVFWPCLSGDAGASLSFVDHMADHHGAQWVRCRAAVRALCEPLGPIDE
jgi:hypothetical protein